MEGINNLIQSKSSTNFINHLNINNDNISDPKEIANTMNNVFNNVGPSTEKSIPFFIWIFFSRKVYMRLVW